jgi:hypothetical protein
MSGSLCLQIGVGQLSHCDVATRFLSEAFTSSCWGFDDAAAAAESPWNVRSSRSIFFGLLSCRKFSRASSASSAVLSKACTIGTETLSVIILTHFLKGDDGMISCLQSVALVARIVTLVDTTAQVLADRFASLLFLRHTTSPGLIWTADSAAFIFLLLLSGNHQPISRCNKS